MEKSEVFTSKLAAQYIGMSDSYLRADRCNGYYGDRTPGPAYLKVGRKVLYRRMDLDQWLGDHIVERIEA